MSVVRFRPEPQELWGCLYPEPAPAPITTIDIPECNILCDPAILELDDTVGPGGVGLRVCRLTDGRPSVVQLLEQRQ